ncbi:MAG: class I SAM-dependent methyltransferase [Hyphomicrobiaceae bacterium]
MNQIEQVFPSLAAIKQKQQATWRSGDYSVLGTMLQIVGEQLCETADLSAGSKVLDVAAGNGNATLAAARRCCDVTSTDYVMSLLEAGQRRADAEGHKINFQVADAEALPFPDKSFDVVLSTFGVMFTPNQEQAARELGRVCRPGGTIAMSNWIGEGFIGQVFKVIGKHVPPPPGLQPPSLWGTEQHLQDLFSGVTSSLSLTQRQFIFRFRSADHFIDVFRTYYGPIHKAFAAVGDEADALEADLRALLHDFNVATDGTLAVPSAYVDVVIRRV